jgi:uncharacterized membrane protein SpoIIM required for sporulation
MAASSDQDSNARAAHWYELRSGLWRDVATRLKTVDRGKSAPPEAVLSLVSSYPEVARDLAIARRESPTGTLARYLEQIYVQLHRTIFRPPSNVWGDLRYLFLHGAAIEAIRLRWHILWVTSLFVVSGLAGWWLVRTYPELAALFAAEQMIDQVSRGELWTDGITNVVPSSVLSVQLFTNNVTVSLTAMCVGILYGLGTFYIIAINGLMLGGVFAFTHNYGMADRLFEWVAAHGPVELSVICIAGAVGASLGEALARPGHLSRLASFQRAVRRGMRLMLVAMIFLIGAGFVEGFVSPNDNIDLTGRLIVGWTYWAVLVVVLSGALGRLVDRRPAPAD